MHLVIFGANGPTGRLLVGQALDAGHKVSVVTRRPARFQERDGLTVVGADVHDAGAVDAAIEGGDVVLSTLGVPFSRQPISVYSVGTANIIAGMKRHGVRRLAVVSASATVPDGHPSGGLLFDRVLVPLVTKVFGRTLYDDMRRMEALVRASDLDWTIVRPSGLFETPSITDYRLTEERSVGLHTSRADLAAALLRQATDRQYVRKAAAVTTTEVKPNMLRMVWREATGQGKG